MILAKIEVQFYLWAFRAKNHMIALRQYWDKGNAPFLSKNIYKIGLIAILM